MAGNVVAPAVFPASNGYDNAMSARTFWTSFLDGLTGEGIFGDLRVPDQPITMFTPEPEEDLVEDSHWFDTLAESRRSMSDE
jgi:hypothetical protein